MEAKYFLEQTIELAMINLDEGGGPFGAIIVNKQNEVIGKGRNLVTKNHDPTAHAEILAIRDACSQLGSFQLDNCILYTICEPCPMCLGAIYWARIESVYYAAGQELAAESGFADAFIYDEMTKEKNNRQIPFYSILLENARKPFQRWMDMDSRVDY